MPKASETYNLKVAHPDIVSEWHPSKNGNLTPQELTPGSGQKIWWRCRKGHDWRAAVYSRSQGNGCPHCHRESIVKGKPVVDLGLLTEWHPTLNSGLNPRSLTAAYNRKIWWLCQNGHEWTATLRDRIKGEKCPSCSPEIKHAGKNTSRLDMAAHLNKNPRIMRLEAESNCIPESYTETDFRKERRYPYRASVMIENSRHGNIIYALMINYSPSGLCIETDYPIRRGEKIIVHIKKAITASSPKSFQSSVRWCKELSDDDGKMVGYSVGLKYLIKR